MIPPPKPRCRRPTVGNIVKALRFLRDSTLESPTDWKTIVEKVEASVDVTDWMSVRNVIQGLVNRGAIKRVADVHREAYYAVTPTTFDAYTR